MQRLIAKSCRKVSIVLPKSSLTYIEHLKNRVARAAAEDGIAYEFAADVDLASAADAIRSYIIKRSKRPDDSDGWICASEISALAVISGINEAGLKIGRDVHVVTKQSSQLLTQFQPGAETVFEDFFDASRQLDSLLPIEALACSGLNRKSFI